MRRGINHISGGVVVGLGLPAILGSRRRAGNVVAHVGSVAQTYPEQIHQSLREDSSAPKGQPAPGPVNGPSFAKANDQRAISKREGHGDQASSDFGKANDESNQPMTTLAPGLGQTSLLIIPWDRTATVSPKLVDQRTGYAHK